ncbi:hypothetical protein ACI65C_002427 [Semiaphis heraclei]
MREGTRKIFVVECTRSRRVREEQSLPSTGLRKSHGRVREISLPTTGEREKSSPSTGVREKSSPSTGVREMSSLSTGHEREETIISRHYLLSAL